MLNSSGVERRMNMYKLIVEVGSLKIKVAEYVEKGKGDNASGNSIHSREKYFMYSSLQNIHTGWDGCISF